MTGQHFERLRAGDRDIDQLILTREFHDRGIREQEDAVIAQITVGNDLYDIG